MPKRTDANHEQIVKGLRAIGATVRSTAMVGDGFPDLAVGFRGDTFLLEVKDGAKSPSRRQLTEAEREFHLGWKGRAGIVHSLEEAIDLVLAGRKVR